MQKIILTTGGTGGHIFPALAVAEALYRNNPGTEVLFVGSHYGPEKELVSRAGIAFEGLPVRGFLGRGVKAFAAGARMSVALVKALGLVGRFRPQVVAGFGGYAAFAPMLAGVLRGVPCLLHEQNAIAGTSNRILGKMARHICLSLPGTEGFPQEKCEITGNPVRQDICKAGGQERGFTSRHLLVLGGSQGAHALNELMIAMLPALKAAHIEILHQTGVKDEQATREAYVAAGYAPDCVQPFIRDMARTYSWADLVLCRSGASTVAELCACGLPALLVPFPHAIHDHQTRNARVMADSGAAQLLPEAGLDADTCSGIITQLMQDAASRQVMSLAARQLAQTDAADRVAKAIVTLAENYGK